VQHKEVERTLEGCLEIGAIFRAPHPKIGEVVQVLAEEVLAVLSVGSGVEDVGVPEFVDRTRGTDLLARVADVEREELAVEILDLVTVLVNPAALFDQLAPEHREITGGDLLESDAHAFVGVQKGVRLFESEGTASGGVVHSVLLGRARSPLRDSKTCTPTSKT
jgi:hypothetical protein